MKITDDIVHAINRTVKILGSKSEFARKANISVVTLRKYLTRTRKNITDETWEKIYPLIKTYLPEKHQHHHHEGRLPDHYRDKSLTSDQRILLDAFAELPQELQEKKLFEVIELAKQILRTKSS